MNISLSEIKRIVLWGSGIIGHKVYEIMRMVEISPIAVIDSDESKEGLIFEDDLVVSGIENVKRIDDEVTIIVLCFGREKYAQYKSEVSLCIKQANMIGYQELLCELATRIYKNPNDKWRINDSDIIAEWLDRFSEEIPYHIKDMKGYCKGGRKPQKIIDRLSGEDIQNGQILIDMGCGGTLLYSPYINGKQIEYCPVDALVDAYSLGHKLYDFVPNTPISFAMSELFTKWYPENYADYIIYDNSLDHTLDPVRSIIESFRVLKKGGILSLKHHMLEAMFGLAEGLHRWDFFVNERGEFVIAFGGTENQVNISKLLSKYAMIKVWKVKVEMFDVIDICVNITKCSDLDNYIICEYDDSKYEGLLIHEMMKKLVQNVMQ